MHSLYRMCAAQANGYTLSGRSSTAREPFELILDLNTDEIVVQHAEVGGDASTTIGVENASGTMATQADSITLVAANTPT
jgi:hypothetical protein